MLIREPVPRSRRDRYRMPDNPWYEATITKTGLYFVQEEIDSLGERWRTRRAATGHVRPGEV
ncbi:hypothetical protein [Micromonospora sp. U21]|uniref:hypothetical protein n=1 Tax=Micromonospora sp. U21 TaxID=2824899 RepID=UPI001FFD7D71|nr:hypothetical protein [Micromonospora sp. U21]